MRNITLVAWPTERYGYDMTYNTEDYPTKVTMHPIEIISAGHSNCSVEYIKAK